MVLATLGLCVRGPTSTCPSKDACCRSQSAICPQRKSSPLESSPGWVFRKGQSWAWPQEAVVITLADCERKTDRLWILRVIRRTNTHLSGSLTLPGQRNLHHFGVINNDNGGDSNYKIDHHHLFFHLLYRRHGAQG